MLSLGKIAAGPQAARYYTDQVALGREDYYAGDGEAPGSWTGSAARAAGLEGEVEAEALAGLLAGGGLRRPVGEGAVAGFDLTFRAPKSVSVLWGVADPAVVQALGEAHDAAVDAALGYVEREACWGRRGAGGVVQVRGGGFVAAAFRHRASRDGDPLLHTHVVVGNLTEGPDGRWTALDARHLYRQAKTAGFLYQAQLRREVTERLGLSWGLVENGTADIDGVPREVIEQFSQRRARILEHMKAHGGRSAASAQVAALETRRAKQDIDADRLRDQWRSRAAEHGLDAATVEHITQGGYCGIPIASDISPETLTQHASVFGRAEVLQALAEAHPRGARVSDLERVADGMLRYREVVALPHGMAPAGVTEPRFTTLDLLATEQDLLDRAERWRDANMASVGHRAVENAMASRSLSPEQQAIVTNLCEGGDGVSVVRAAAGTGKTFVLDAAREAWQDHGITVVGCALSARAALELQDQAAISSMTIAQLSGRLAGGERLLRGGVLVVDEAGMVGTRDLGRLAEAAELARAKLVLVGDDRQLSEIQAGGAFHALAERLPKNELREVRRQQQAWDRQALDELRSGEVERWARAYRDHGHITVADSATATRAALINDWSQASGDKLMIAARREDVADLNQRARELLQDRGELAPDELSAAGRGYCTGDRVVGARNDRQAGILNGQRGTVTATHPDNTAIELRLDNGAAVVLGADYLDAGHLDHGYAITAHRAQGATVDRTFVLGSEELYREWGYTAMSRHREQARFYVARADIAPDRELPEPYDPVIDGVTRLLNRSHTKELALQSLPHEQREQLERDRQELRERFISEPPPQRAPRVEDADARKAASALQLSQDAEARLLDQRAGLRWHERGARSSIDTRLEALREQQHTHQSHLEQLVETRDLAEATDHTWLGSYGEQATRLLSVSKELHKRDVANTHAAARVKDLQPDPLAHDLPSPSLDYGLDL